MGQYSLASYFQNMKTIGSPLNSKDEENYNELRKVEEEIREAAEKSLAAGKPDEKVNERGEMTALQRIAELIDEGTWCPLNTIYNPGENDHGTTGIVKGLAKVDDRWVYIVASDNKKLAGAWIAGQADDLLRASDTAERLRIPLVYILNCSGVKLDEQEKVYPNRRGGGTPFYRNSRLNQCGVPVIVGIYGTNPAGGGYHSISPTILIAHKDANMAVGGAGILGGMSPKGYIDMESANQIADATANAKKTTPPGSVGVHFAQTGFMREVYTEEEGVLEGIRKYLSMLPKFDRTFFRVDDPKMPLYPAEDMYSVLPKNTKKAYDVYEVIARLFDGSEFMEYKKGYGPEMVTGLAKVNGLLVGVVANVQGLLMNYPEYYEGRHVGIGGKLYRQGLIKMNEFVTLCARDRLPIVWLQDTTGIDVGDDAEKAELLGLGQSLIYSIQKSDLPQMEITMRKGTAAAHYVLGGPQGNDTNAFSLGTAATEINVMHGETAANAMYSRRLAKDKKAGKDLQPTIDKMNKLIEDYNEKSRPFSCAKYGLVDEIINMDLWRNYIIAFTEACYQDPISICPVHQMLLPRIIRDYDNLNNIK